MTTTPGRRWPIWPWLVLAAAGIGITAVAAFAGAAATSEGDASATTPPGPTVTVTQVQTNTSTVTRTLTATPAPAPSGQIDDGQIDDGLFEVGPDIPPGTYRTDGPDGTNRTGCYWNRIDSSGETVANGKLTRPGTVTLVAGERFDTAGCQPWALVP